MDKRVEDAINNLWNTVDRLEGRIVTPVEFAKLLDDFNQQLQDAHNKKDV